MKNKLILYKNWLSMLFFDTLCVLVGDNWKDMRKESATIYKLLKVMYKC